MKIFIFSLLIGTTLARDNWPTEAPTGTCREGTNAKAEIQIDLDYWSYSSPGQINHYNVGPFYWIKYDRQGIPRRLMRPVAVPDCECTPDEEADIATWVIDYFDKPTSAHVFNGCNYFHVPGSSGATADCYNDIDGCGLPASFNNINETECGYTIETDVNPDRNVTCLHWLANFGHSNNGQEFGVYVGFMGGKFVVVHSITSSKSVKKICSLAGTNGTIPNHWFYLSVVYNPENKNDVEIYVDNVLLVKCLTHVADLHGVPSKVLDMIVGAAKNGPGSPVIDSPYKGAMNQMCWFNRMVSTAERALMMTLGGDLKRVNSRASCYWIGSVQSYKKHYKLI